MDIFEKAPREVIKKVLEAAVAYHVVTGFNSPATFAEREKVYKRFSAAVEKLLETRASPKS